MRFLLVHIFKKWLKYPAACAFFDTVVKEIPSLMRFPPIYLNKTFVILQFEISNLMNLILSLFTGLSRQVYSVQTRKKASSANCIFQTGELQKTSHDTGCLNAKRDVLNTF